MSNYTNLLAPRPCKPKWNVAMPSVNAVAVPGWSILNRRAQPSPGWTVDRIAYQATYPAPVGTYPGALGINVHNGSPLAAWFPIVRQQGVPWARITLGWNSYEPVAPVAGVHTYNWVTSDAIMAAASSAGMSMLLLLSATPTWATVSGQPWATAGVDTSPNPSHFADFSAFAVAVCQRYGIGGAFWTANPSLVPVPIAVELWNEPYLAGGWGGAVNPANYASLAHAAASAIHAAGTGVTCGAMTEWTFIVSGNNFHQALLVADPTMFAEVDWFSMHPYTNTVPPRQASGTTSSMFARIGAVQSTIISAGQPLRPLWITEFGFTNSQGVDANGAADPHYVSEAQAATWLRDAVDLAFQHFKVAKFFYYDYADYSPDASGNPMGVSYDPATGLGGGLVGDQTNYGLIEYGSDAHGVLNWNSPAPAMKPAWAQFLAYAG